MMLLILKPWVIYSLWDMVETETETPAFYDLSVKEERHAN